MLGLLRKKDYRATLAGSGQVVVVKGGDKLLNAALAAGLAWPHDCRVGSCGTCRCMLKTGSIKRLTDFSYTLAAADIARGAILACQTQLRSDVVVEVALDAGAVGLERQRGRLLQTRPLTHDILQVDIALERPAFGAAKAGQYAELSIPALAQPRSYSFARAPGKPAVDALTFIIRHVPGGAFTDWLFAADRSGTEVELTGPHGGFYYRHATGRMVCIAGGSGLAPIHALLEDAVNNEVARDCTVLFGARTQADLYYLDELASLGRSWRGDFALLPVLSAEPEGSAWPGARGLVTGTLSTVAPQGFGANDQAYLCGPPPMVDAGIAALRGLGMVDSAIYCDKFFDASTQPGGRAALSS